MSNGKEDILYVGDSFIDAKTVEHAQVSFAGVFPFTLPSTGGIFLRGGGSGIACPGFSVLRFRREFLSRMRILKGNRAGMHGLARCGKDAA